MARKRKLGTALLCAAIFLALLLSSCSPEGKAVQDITKKSMMGQQAEGIKKVAEHIELCNEFALFSEDACASDERVTITLENTGKRAVHSIKIVFFDEEGTKEEKIFKDTYIKRGSEEYTFDAPFLARKILLIPTASPDGQDTTEEAEIECLDRAIVLDELRWCTDSP